MNFSELYKTALSYLGFYGEPTKEAVCGIEDGLREARLLSHFRAAGKIYAAPLPFLEKEPYRTFLAGCSSYALVAMTLGIEIERRVRALFLSDPARAVVLDACASALIEAEGDEWEEQFGEERTFRFCPGYGGSDVKDVKQIFLSLRPDKLGIQLLASGQMVPQKSMAGVIGLGRKKERSCGACMLRGKCAFLQEGTTCYRSGKNSS